MNAIRDIDTLVDPTHDELARQGFVSRLRKHIMKDVADDMQAAYEKSVKLDFVASHGREPDSGEEVRDAIADNLTYRVWSSLRYNAQEMVWESVREEVERQLPEMISISDQAQQSNSHGGSLTLDPDLEMPDYIDILDVHLMPGCWHDEHAKGDVAQGAIYAHGGLVFRGSLLPSKTRSGVAASVSKWLSIRYPDFKPEKILETGCTIGNNLFPYKDIFPDAELTGVDLAAPCLRYAHARAAARGIDAQFSQQNAEKLNFAENTFDLVVSSFFFHETSVAATKRILGECRRILKPGGMMVHMELPPASQVDAYYNFYLDWDNEHNNEPHYRDFRSQECVDLLASAGFSEGECFTASIPDVGGADPNYFRQVALGKTPPPAHGNYTSWALFGAIKSE
ncbi:MAG: class I SAM-dependent methyltransferase [Rhodospirillaceae bacterium]|nr:class I SAM-dependent methyltransferase [Rhodospirillaceae bacterium]